MNGGMPIAMQECAPSLKEMKIDEEAEIKAMTLLKKKIGETNFIKLVALGYFEVKGKYGIYHLGWGEINLHRFDTIGKKIRPLIWTLCVDASKDIGYIPKGDRIFTFYFSITENEEKFIQESNFRFVITKDEFEERRRKQT